MKTFTLCVAGIGAGIALAFATQNPVILEKLGFSGATAESTDVAMESDMGDAKTKAMESEVGSAVKSEATASADGNAAADEASAKPPAIAKRADGVMEGASGTKVVAKKPAMKDMAKSKMAKESDMAEESEKPNKMGEVPEELDGKWLVTRAVHGNSRITFDKLQAMTLEVAGKEIVIGQGDKREIGTLESSVPSKIGETSFAEIKISSAKGKGKDIRGFYYLDDGELTMIWGAPGEARPDPTNQEQFAKARILTMRAAQ